MRSQKKKMLPTFRKSALTLAVTACFVPAVTRGLPATDPSGPEFRVNTVTRTTQDHPAVAFAADGRFVVVWQSDEQDGDGYGVYAQRYTASGSPQEDETRINTVTASQQRDVAVAMNASGQSVVVWAGYDNSNGYDIYFQRFDAAGAPQGGEQRANSRRDQNQRHPQVAMDADGDFVMTWHSYGRDSDESGVEARRFDASGSPLADEFLVNTTQAGSQYQASVAMDPAGDFVVAWESHLQIKSSCSYYYYGDCEEYNYDTNQNIYAQRYNAAGVPQGGEITVATRQNSGNLSAPAVGIADDGHFAVTFLDQNGYDIYTRGYDSLGAPTGAATLVNDVTSGHQFEPAMSMNGSGDYVVVWASQPSGAGDFDIRARTYSAAGVAQGNEFLVNTATSNNQVNPVVALDAAGDYVVAWGSDQKGQARYDVQARRYVAPAPPTPPPAISGIDAIGSSRTNAASVSWTVRFDQPVSGVDATDFELLSKDLSAPAITGVTAVSSSVYTVTASTGSGSGSMSLHLVDNDSIVSIASGLPLGGSGVNDGGAYNGSPYSIDRTGPSVTINQAAGQADPTANGTIHFTAVFSGPVSDFESVDVSLSGLSGLSATGVVVTYLSPSDSYDVAVSGMTANGNVIASIAAGAAHDDLGNPSLASTSSDNDVVYTGAGPVADTTPDAFGFTPQTDAAPDTPVFSEYVTITGIDADAPISVSGATSAYQIFGQSLTSTAGTIRNGDRVRVRLRSSVHIGETRSLTLTVGTASVNWQVTTGSGSDTTPDAFAFTDVTGATADAAVFSDFVTIKGLSADAPISVTGDTSAYQIQGGTLTSAAGTIHNGDKVRLRLKASTDGGRTRSATLTIGGVATTWKVTTVGGSDTTPDAFTFADVSNAAPNTPVFSEYVTISGLDAETPISVSGTTGGYQIQGKPCTNMAGTLVNGDRVRVRLKSAATSGQSRSLVLNIGGVTRTWTVTTQ